MRGLFCGSSAPRVFQVIGESGDCPYSHPSKGSVFSMSDELRGKLRTIRVNFAGTLMASCLIRRQSSESLTAAAGRLIVGEDGFYCVGHDAEVPSEAGDYYEISVGGSESARDRTAMEVAKMGLRNLTSDAYEATFDHCERTGQLEAMQSEPWYQFARVIRNSLTHTQEFRFRPSVLKNLPTTWRGREISASMDGSEVPFTFFDWHVALELFDDIYEFSGRVS